MHFKIIRMPALIFCLIFFCSSTSFAGSSLPIQNFSLDNYNQDVDHWISPNNPEYDKPLLTENFQKQKLEEYYRHYFDSSKKGLSPWSKNYMTEMLQEQNILDDQQKRIETFDNQNKDPEKIGYGENFRAYPLTWIDKIKQNMNLSQFEHPFKFSQQNRGILVQNTYARALPSMDPFFYHFEIPGEGYPFDVLQMSALWVGTPIYVLGESKDKEWSLIATPELIAWVPSESLAKVNQRFINLWQTVAKKNLGAIVTTETPISDVDQKKYYFKAYVGSVFPFLTKKKSDFLMLFPVRDLQGNAQMKRSLISPKNMVEMPLKATPHYFANLIKTLQNRPYGWGGLYFYNDCSAELKSLFTPFGIWLPRNSYDQRNAGKRVVKTEASIKERIEYLKTSGKPFLTIVYNTRHVFLYLGNEKINNSKESVPITYQNVWGLRPEDSSHRAIIGQSLIFPLLPAFSEDKNLQSQAGKKDFEVIFLDQ